MMYKSYLSFFNLLTGILLRRETSPYQPAGYHEVQFGTDSSDTKKKD